ncbi:MAG: type I restriction enzyme, S subunit [Candidatus Methanocomedens sp.]|nr:MAG: type I restriction enzyme, S subunit [ANME-2 cluster archaeon]
MNQESFFKNFQLLVDAHNGVQKLRELILQMAIHGNLITQDLNEESVFKQLEKIKSDKNQLIQKRKLKLRNISENNDVNILKYKIPSNWCWFRLPEVVFFQEGPGIRNWQFKSHGIKLLNVQNILPNNKTLFEKSDKYVSEEEVNEKYEHFLIEEGDLLFAASGGSWGKSAWFYDPGYKIMLNTSTIRLKFFSDEFEPNYLKYFLDSSFFKKQMELQLVGMQPNFGSTHLGRVYIPIPPLEEQKRIVAKADQLMAHCDQLEARQQKKYEQRILLNNAALDKLLTAPTPEEFAQHWQRICDNFDLLYGTPETVGQLRQAILQLAVQGKLVAQDIGDEPASVLLEKIEAEKNQLVKEKKIKRIRSLPQIDPQQIPYELPYNWEWVRLGDVGHDCGQKKPDKKFTYIDVSAINKEQGVISENVDIIEPSEAPSRARKLVSKGSVIYATVRPYLLNIAIIDKHFKPEPIVSTAFAVLHPYSGILNKYLYYYLRSKPFITYVESEMIGMAYPAINDGKLYKGLVPIPPLQEQKRIVAKVDQLMALCDELEAGLVQAQTEGGKLMEAVVHHVLAG